MARLPQPGSDQGKWGNLLNEFLEVSHEGDGTIKQSAITDDHITSIDQSKVTGLGASLAAKADNNTVVHTTGNQTVGGVKTFSSSPIVPTPSTANQAANKTYVDTAVGVATGSAMPSVTVKMRIPAIDQTYSREIPLYNNSGVWTIDETMTVPFHLPTSAAPKDVLQVSLSMKEVLASGLYGMNFSVVALDVMTSSVHDILSLSRNDVGLMESNGDMAVSWATATVESFNEVIVVGGDGITIQYLMGDRESYLAVLRVKGQLNFTSGN